MRALIGKVSRAAISISYWKKKQSLQSPTVAYFFSTNTNTKQTQLETAKMSKLQCTHLADISKETFELFKRYVQTEEIQYLNGIFQQEGFEIRMAGGGVRDLLCHIVPNDIDFATNAKPEQMIQMMSDKPEIRLITTVSGQKHGTVTARINQKVQYEITTLRIDKQTNGRHAEVEFINDWNIDASRRDLTINSMFIDLNGLLYDYFGGESDLRNRIIRFVGDPEKRIQEDYLRIFRYFRFHSRFGVANSHDEAVLAVMERNLAGLQQISGERIWAEMKRILASVQCANSMETMFSRLHIGQYMGFHNVNFNLNEFHTTLKRLACYESQQDSMPIQWKPQTIFSSLIDSSEELCSIVSRLRLSNQERDTMAYIVANRKLPDPFNIDMLKSQLALAPKPTQPSLREHIGQYLMYMGATPELISTIYHWPIPSFPFQGHMVANRVKQKRQISQLLNHLKSIWAKNNFTMSNEDMQKEVDRFLQQINNEK